MHILRTIFILVSFYYALPQQIISVCRYSLFKYHINITSTKEGRDDAGKVEGNEQMRAYYCER